MLILHSHITCKYNLEKGCRVKHIIIVLYIHPWACACIRRVLCVYNTRLNATIYMIIYHVPVSGVLNASLLSQIAVLVVQGSGKFW